MSKGAEFSLESWFHFILFMIMGSGANWVLATALTQEIPYFQNNLPEGLCLAAYMNATNNFGLIAMTTYLCLNKYIIKVPHHYSVPFLLVVSFIGCFISAVVYPITAGNVSIMLYFCCAIGGLVGALSSVIMNPFMTSYKNNYISAARSGGSALILICALLSIAQDPGSDNQRFSVGVYMSIFGFLLIPPVFAYRYITTHKIGLREVLPSVENDVSDNPLMKSQDMQSVVVNNGFRKSSNEETSQMSTFELETTGSSSPTPTASLHDLVVPKTHFLTFLNPYMTSFTKYIITDSFHEQHPWLRSTVPYMMTVGWVNFNTWGVIVAMMPFAISNISSGNGSQNLAIAYQLGAVLLVSGDLSTTLFRMPILFGLFCFTTFCFTIYLAALNVNGFQTPAAPGFIITIFAVERFIEAHLVTSAYRAIATEFPVEYRQAASRAVGVSDQVSTTVGAILSTLVVSLLFSCSASS